MRTPIFSQVKTGTAELGGGGGGGRGAQLSKMGPPTLNYAPRSLKNLSPQNGGFRRAFLVVPDSYEREFRAVARSVVVFCQAKFTKRY